MIKRLHIFLRSNNNRLRVLLPAVFIYFISIITDMNDFSFWSVTLSFLSTLYLVVVLLLILWNMDIYKK